MKKKTAMQLRMTNDGLSLALPSNHVSLSEGKQSRMTEEINSARADLQFVRDSGTDYKSAPAGLRHAATILFLSIFIAFAPQAAKAANVTLADLVNALVATTDGFGNYTTIVTCTIPSGDILTISSGETLTISFGFLYNYGTITNNGVFNNGTANPVINYGVFTNSGTINNS